jgi:hypothetical protein
MAIIFPVSRIDRFVVNINIGCRLSHKQLVIATHFHSASGHSVSSRQSIPVGRATRLYNRI